MKVLFVCSGNICRSPMAAEYFRARAADSGLNHIVVDSAGLLGIEGEPASLDAIRVVREAGLDLRGHRSRGIRPEDVVTTDVAVVMTHDHGRDLVERFGVPESRILLLRRFEDGPESSPDGPDLPDPIGKSIEFYRRNFETIRTCVDHLVIWLRSRHAAARGSR